MYKVLYIGGDKQFDVFSVSNKLTLLCGSDVGFVKERFTDDGMTHFFEKDPIVLLLIEESIEDLDRFISSIKEDESFSSFPIILVSNNEDRERRKGYFFKEITSFLKNDFDDEELCLTCYSQLKNKIKLEDTLKQLSEVSEKNITKALQLDLLKKFIPLTVWEKTESLAEGQIGRAHV